jgi:thiol-disulfide isomerase/thioredoxin
MKKLFLALLLLPFFSFAQHEADGKGMKFEHGLSWKEIKAKARAENKYIFMDCFTTWCGPCKYMSANIFPMAEVGDFFNRNYLMI